MFYGLYESNFTVSFTILQIYINNRKNIKFSKYTKNYVIYYVSSKLMYLQETVLNCFLNNIDYVLQFIFYIHLYSRCNRFLIIIKTTVIYPLRPFCSPHRARGRGELIIIKFYSI